MGMVKEFKEFIMRGNVMDMAVGVIVGGAFSAIVNSLGVVTAAGIGIAERVCGFVMLAPSIKVFLSIF